MKMATPMPAYCAVVDAEAPGIVAEVRAGSGPTESLQIGRGWIGNVSGKLFAFCIISFVEVG
jgi:hypothetical protein